MANIPEIGNVTYPGKWSVDITSNSTTNAMCRAVYIGVDDNYDFYFDNSVNTGSHQSGWQTFNGCKSGTVIPIQVSGARHTSGSTAPDANDIVFIY